MSTGAYHGITLEQYAELKDLLADAESCGRLSNWEQDFIADFRDRFDTFGVTISISPKQWEVLRRIEGKVYAT